jgi:hypothetical protein
MQAALSSFARTRPLVFWWLAVVALASLRLCHIRLLWSDEDYHLAAALRILNGQFPYRDFWYDKPPLAAFYYLLTGAYPGWLLRLLDTTYVLLACACAYRLAFRWWGAIEARWAGLLLAFFTAFYLPAAVIPFASDALLLLPHLAAIDFARRRLPLAAGLCCGIGLIINIKAVFVLAACGVWLLPASLPLLALSALDLLLIDILLLLAGFLIPVLGVVLWLALAGALPAFYDQVWRWGLLYAQGAPLPNRLFVDLSRIANWLGFHAALLLAGVFAWIKSDRDDRFRLAAWFALSFASVCLGNHFAPRYFWQVLPPLVLAAARGATLAWNAYGRPALALGIVFLVVPFLRFGPRYASLAIDNLEQREPHWSDVALDLDSRHAAVGIRALAHPGDTLFVWGYRPDLYVYTRLISDSRFWDSQPLTGVPADRHLTAATALFTGPAALHRAELVRSHPTFIVDGLGPLNPALSPQAYPEVRRWLADYAIVTQTPLSTVYRRIR